MVPNWNVAIVIVILFNITVLHKELNYVVKYVLLFLILLSWSYSSDPEIDTLSEASHLTEENNLLWQVILYKDTIIKICQQ